MSDASDLALDPELGPVARQAVTRAIAAEGVADDAPGAHGTAWWRAGLEDATDRAPGDVQAASPRSTRGATRA